MLVAPAAAGAAVVVWAPAAVPMPVMRAVSTGVPSGRRPCSYSTTSWPTTMPAVLVTLTLVSPTPVGATVVVAGPAAVPMPVTVPVSAALPVSITNGSPTL